jgi:hypothetical protein
VPLKSKICNIFHNLLMNYSKRLSTIQEKHLMN